MNDRVVQTVAPRRRPRWRLPGRQVHAGNPPAPRFPRLRGIAHVDRHEHVVGETVEQNRYVSPAPAGVPGAVDATALDRHETDLARCLRLRDVVDRQAGAPVARSLGLGRADGLAEGAAVIGALVGKFRCREHVLGVNDQQQIVVNLQMDVPGICRCRDVVHRAWTFRIANVDDRKALGKHVTHESESAVHHHLHAVGPATLIGVPDNAHVARVIRFRKLCHLYASRKCGTAIQSSIAPSLCSRSCMRRSSSVFRLTPR